ncbi:outer membrane lipoprotein carrier protein LolA [Motiliproteus coralliicola]|uniref:Outer-membrane lipoprotein carrier protein n=1 Tax=Motiliproteus coralliicola TaxID=2283196 RepID=A0A369WUJ5_9GAMM|nr:outer membrane lipoprotein chaperone LolA [Motiliproteus coralliicola]RDE24739.1 outer membrane lipoprotein carrier protein LolA [Motiliproteus coralliicola]
MNGMIRLFLTVLLSLNAGWLQAADAGQNLHRLLGKIDSLSARFEQLVLDGGGTRLQQSQGEMVLARPGKFRWRTDEPFPQLLVSDGQTLWMYDEDLEQVTRQAVDQQLSNTPALLLSGDLATLQDSFQIQGPVEGDSGTFRLLPNSEDALFTVLRMQFVSGVPIEMQLEDNLGQQTSVHFYDLTLNPTLESQQFEFQVPDGVDLIEQ